MVGNRRFCRSKIIRQFSPTVFSGINNTSFSPPPPSPSRLLNANLRRHACTTFPTYPVPSVQRACPPFWLQETSKRRAHTRNRCVSPKKKNSWLVLQRARSFRHLRFNVYRFENREHSRERERENYIRVI